MNLKIDKVVKDKEGKNKIHCSSKAPKKIINIGNSSLNARYESLESLEKPRITIFSQFIKYIS